MSAQIHRATHLRHRKVLGTFQQPTGGVGSAVSSSLLAAGSSSPLYAGSSSAEFSWSESDPANSGDEEPGDSSDKKPADDDPAASGVHSFRASGLTPKPNPVLTLTLPYPA